jgi:PAS domain S-box-containing protein
MPAPPGTKKRSIPPRQDEAAQDISAEVERLVTERLQELQVENNALRREIARLQNTDTILLESEEKCRLLFDTSIDGILLTEPDGTILAANPGACRMLGRTEEEIRQAGRSGIVDMDDPKIPFVLEERARTGKAQSELTLIRKDGTRFKAEVSSALFKNRDGRIQTSMILRDITERKRAEEALRESEERLRGIFDTAGIGIAIVDMSGRILETNPSLRKILGYTADDLVNCTFLDIAHPEDNLADWTLFVELITGVRDSYVLEKRYLARGGRTVWGRMTASLLRDAEGKPQCAIRMLEDTTERKQAEETLREQRNLLKTVFTASPNFLVLKDRESVYKAVNPAFCIFLGRSEEEIIGKTDYDLFPPDEAEAYRKGDSEVMETGIPENDDWEVTGAEGQQWLHVNKTAVPGEMEQCSGVLCSVVNITDRRQAEDALQESEEKYRTLFDTMSDAFSLCEILCGADGIPDDFRYLEMNSAWEKETGLSHEQFLGKRASEVLPDLEPNWIKTFGRVAQTGETVRFEDYNQNTGRWYEVIAFCPSQGRFATLFRNVTERKQAEEALRESEEQYHSLFETMHEGVVLLEVVSDEEGRPVDIRYLDVNPAGERFFGRDRTEMIATTYRSLGGEKADLAWMETLTNVALTGEPASIERVVPFNRRWISVKAYSPRKGQVVTIFEDITERKQAEEALKHAHQQLLDIIEFLPDATFVIDRNHRAISWNRAMEKLTGVSKEDVIGKGDYAYAIPFYGKPRPLMVNFILDGKKEIASLYDTFHSEKGICTAEIYIPETYDGREAYFWGIAAPLVDSNGQIVGAIETIRDITERKRAEEALRQHTEDLTQLQRELEVSNREANLYLDILTHDIRNTENVSNLYAELLADTLEGEAAGYMENLQRSIKKSIEILSAVSTIRRIHQTSSELKPIDLDAVVQGVIEDYLGSIFCYNGAHHQVQADNLLSVIFNNLIGNAVKHGGPGVEIAVRVKEEDGVVQVSIEDTGPGVPDDEKHEIFHRYEKKKRGVGEGLGLYLVQILVERYGGRVWVEDRVPGHSEEGATFKFTLKKA